MSAELEQLGLRRMDQVGFVVKSVAEAEKKRQDTYYWDPEGQA